MMVKRLPVLLVVPLLGAAALLLSGGTAHAATTSSRAVTFSNRLLTLVNRSREQHGLRPLDLAHGTTVVAKRWAAHLAGADDLEHNPQLAQQVERHGSRNWTDLGENVAVGQSARTIFRNYMHSPEHRANILDPHYRFVGVGVAFGHGGGFNVLDFVDRYHG